MSIFTIPRSRFDWPKFARAVSQFVLPRGTDEVFQLVQDGQVILDMEELTLDDGEEIEDIPADPVERLEAGFDLAPSIPNGPKSSSRTRLLHFGATPMADNWYILRDGKRHGPYTGANLKKHPVNPPPTNSQRRPSRLDRPHAAHPDGS